MYCYDKGECSLNAYGDENGEYLEGEGEDDFPQITTADAGTVDIGAYLFSFTGVSWKIDELTGGNANHTVRATRIGSRIEDGSRRDGDAPLESVGGWLLGERSVIVKYAPTFFYKSPSIELDSYRQTVEARALYALHDPTSALYRVGLAIGKDVSVPVLRHHSPSHNVLIESDLGDLPPVNKFLMSSRTTLEQATRAGDLLARYLVELHQSIRFASSEAVSRLEQGLSNSYVEPTIISVIGQAENYMRMAGIPDYEVLGKRAKEHWTGRKKNAFGQGDIWYGTVLVDASGGDGEVRLGICDWEFAGPNHPAGDVAQFGAYLQLSISSPLVGDQQRLAVRAFTDAFYSAYFQHLESIIDDDLGEFRRSMIILHGWELINASAWRQYLWCSCTASDVALCPHSREMVGVGARMLRAAAAGEREINWKELESTNWSRYFSLQHR